MNKLELFEKLFKVNTAINEKDFKQLAYALGLTDEIIKEMTILDISDAINVRLSDLNKQLEESEKSK
jgi:hypothetical protein